jgi:hypothetical protein
MLWRLYEMSCWRRHTVEQGATGEDGVIDSPVPG